MPPDVAKSLPCWLSQFRKAKLRQPTGQRLSNVRVQPKKISIVPILFLYYEESLVSSNLNSKQLRFHGAHAVIHTLQLRWNLLPNIYLLLHLLKLILQETAIYMHKRYLVSDGFSGFYWEFFENWSKIVFECIKRLKNYFKSCTLCESPEI